MKYKKILIILSFLLILDISLILTGFIKPIDDIIYQFIINFESLELTQFLIFISFLASTKFIIMVSIIVFIIAIISKRTDLQLIIINSILSALVNRLTKLIFARPRPTVYPLVSETFYSFPSGHSMISVLTYGTILYLINKSNFKYKIVFNIIIPLFILLVGISRVYLGVHYISDCVGGYLVSSIMLLLIINIKEKNK